MTVKTVIATFTVNTTHKLSFMTRIISVANMKGGVGKTTIGLHLANCLAINKGLKVIYLDCDHQESATDYRAFEKADYEIAPPYPIEKVAPKYIAQEVKYHNKNYDVIFIDIPRITNDQDEQIGTMLAVCDSILIPFKAGDLEGLSIKRFSKIIRDLATYKESKDFDFSYYGFHNLKRNKLEDKSARKFMEHHNIPTFEATLPDVVSIGRVSTFESILNTKEGRRRFEPFFNEFIAKFNF